MWEVAVTCENYLHVYSARNNYEFLRLSLIFGSSCSLHQEHHGKPILYPCRIGWRGEVIYSWNTSDQWSSVNENEATYCEKNTSLSNPQDSIPEGHIRQPYYKNIFCAMCPSDFIPTNVYACSFVNTSKKCYYFAITIDYMPSFAIGIRHYKILPISLLLGSIGGRKTSHQPEVEFQKCQTWEWLSPDGSCLHIKCSSGKYLNGSTCKTALNSITGLGYMSRMFYLPINKFSYQFSAVNRNDRLQLLNDFMIHLQKQTLFNSDLAETQLQVTCIQDSNLFDVNVNFDGNNFSSKTLHHHMTNITEQIISQESQFFFYVSAHFVANRNISRDDFETEILTSLSFNESQVQIGTNSTIILESMFMPDVPDFSSNTDQHSSEQSDFVDLQTKIMSNINDKESFLWTNKRDFLLLSPILTCPHVYFRKSNYSFYVNCSTFPPIWQITLNLGNIELIFSTFSELNKMAWVTDDTMTNGHLKVCLNLLEEKLHEIKDSETAFSFDNNAMYMWQYYLTHVCMSLSMMCLFMTVLAFILLTSLRNNAGINNMFLSGTLLLAQCSLLSSTHVQGPSTFCIALGISTHFLWLSVTFWSLTCCYDMFRVFNSKTGILKLKDISQRITLAKKITVNLFVPTLIISSVVLVITLISAGERIGYTDSNPCYLETRVLVLISFVAPLCFVTAINVIFFAATVYKIRNVRKLYAHTGFKRNEFETFIIYVKLSTLTGSFWVVAIISEQLDNDPLRIVAIIINSLQGVFLFVSFICNKRVMRTCFQSIPQRTCSTSTNSSVTTGGSEDSRQYERYSSF